MSTPKPLIFDIARGSFVDGPGIRTVVFMQGCPMACSWCHNPESQPFNATSNSARLYRPEDLIEYLLRDRHYYTQSGGGVTFSGGEPLAHSIYLHDIASALKKEDIHIAFDTSGYFNYDIFSKYLKPYTDLLIYDLKIMNPAKHKNHTGKDNRIILKNLKQAVKDQIPIKTVIPLIPGLTATEQNLSSIAELILKLYINDYTLLPYNNSSIDKLKSCGRVPAEGLPKKPMDRKTEEQHRQFFMQQLKQE